MGSRNNGVKREYSKYIDNLSSCFAIQRDQRNGIAGRDKRQREACRLTLRAIISCVCWQK